MKDQLKKRTAEFDELEANSEKAKNSAEAEIAQLREETEQLKNDRGSLVNLIKVICWLTTFTRTVVQALATPAVIPASDDDNKLLKLYVELTGLIVSPTPEEPVSWDCALQCPIGGTCKFVGVFIA